MKKMQVNYLMINSIVIVLVINVCSIQGSFRYGESDLRIYRGTYPDTECEIECVPIQECNMVVKLIQGPSWSQRKRKFILSLRCDNFKGEAKVWCITEKEQPCRHKASTESYPQDPSVKIQCVPVKECYHVVQLFNTKPLTQRIKEYIYSIRCDEGRGGPKVWCTNIIGSAQSQNEETVSLPDATKNQCGISRISKDDPNDEEGQELGILVAYGENADLGEFPWMALLEYRNRRRTLVPKCGGSLISSRYVLTAAHCLNVDQRLLQLESVLLGEHDTKEVRDCVIGRCKVDCCFEAQRYAVESFIAHPSYRESARLGLHQHDVGLIRLERDVELSEYIKPVCLPTSTFKMDSESAQFKVAGWGLTENATVSNILQSLELPTYDSVKCSNLLGYQVSDNQLCAGGEEQKDTCNGDSGGPLMYAKSLFDRQVTQIGIVSLSVGRTCGSGRPNIYTDVRRYMDWIDTNLRP